MSKASSIPYQLRPNKAVDRELFLSLLSRLGATLQIENYKYIGLGGPFLEDFRLLHAKIGIKDMMCIEREEAVYKRQLFNKPIESITCVHESLEDYLDENEFDSPVVLWLDYTEPKSILNQIETFTNQLLNLPINSIIRITLNANASSLGDNPDPEWRLKRFKERLEGYYPANIKPEEMKATNYGKTLLRALSLAVTKTILNTRDRKFEWGLATHYSDGQPMVTSTLIILDHNDNKVENVLKSWEFYSTPEMPHILDLPALSTRERLAMESRNSPKEELGFELPKSRLNEDPYTTFRKYYRVFPQFARVDI